jgi:hypothetical protein
MEFLQRRPSEAVQCDQGLHAFSNASARIVREQKILANFPSDTIKNSPQNREGHFRKHIGVIMRLALTC